MAKQYLDFTGLAAYDEKIKQWVKDLPQDSYDDTALSNAVTSLQELVGDTSVANQIATAIEAVVNGAPGNFDTLKELSDWINEHGEAAAALVQTVAEQGQAIADVDAKVEAITAISGTYIDALFLDVVVPAEGQSIQSAIFNLKEGQKLVLSEDVAEDIHIMHDATIEAEDVTFTGKITVDSDAKVTIIGATFAGEVVIAEPEIEEL